MEGVKCQQEGIEGSGANGKLQRPGRTQKGSGFKGLGLGRFGVLAFKVCGVSDGLGVGL